MRDREVGKKGVDGENASWQVWMPIQSRKMSGLKQEQASVTFGRKPFIWT
jgi:hypothetical protein